MNNCIKTFELSNGLTIHIHDTTRRYYGDYHLVRLEVVCEVPLVPDYFDDCSQLSEAQALLGETAVYSRQLEKMGVPYQGIEAAREDLINGLETTLDYFSSEGFPRKLVLSELSKARDKSGRRHCSGCRPS